MYEQFDFDTLGVKVSNKAVKDKAREITTAEIFAVLSAHYGEDFVSMVGTASIAISAGSRTVDGVSTEVPLVISVVAKEFEAHATASGKSVEVYDRYDEAEAYAAEVAKAKQKAEEAAAKKAKQIAANEAAKAANKAKKAAKQGAE